MPVPSLPRLLLPHAHTVPSDINASAWFRPPATSMTLLRPLTVTGDSCRVGVVPFPNPAWLVALDVVAVKAAP